MPYKLNKADLTDVKETLSQAILTLFVAYDNPQLGDDRIEALKSAGLHTVIAARNNLEKQIKDAEHDG